VVRKDIRSSFGTGSATANGVALTLELTALDIAGGGDPMAGAAVYAWHCDAGGSYSMYSSGLENENYLRGVQVTDSSGVVSFTTIVPGCYSGRWPHIHFEVYPDEASITDSSSTIATSQVALPRAMCDAVYATDGYASSVGNFSSMSLASDNVFGDDAGVHQLATVTGDTSAGFTARLTVPIDTTTAPTGGGMR
jgi:protocatechuate 3,4-dioxygenase beta subunit